MDTEDRDAGDFEEGSNNIVDAIEQVESAVKKVEQAVKDKWSSVTIIGWLLIGAFLWDLPGEIWHAKWRYAMSYGVNSDSVIVAARPHDCAFLAAPLGEKYCHHEREISTLRWATSVTGNPIASWDEGKTWTAFTPDAGVSVPKYDTVHQVHQLEKDRGVRGVNIHFTHFKITSTASGTVKMATTTVNPICHPPLPKEVGRGHRPHRNATTAGGTLVAAFPTIPCGFA